MTARAEVVAALRTVIPDDILVIPYAKVIDPPKAPTVLVRVDQVEPLKPWRRYGFALIVVTPYTNPDGPADENLDEVLEDVLYALDRHETITWDRARRSTFQERPAYLVSLSIPFTKELTP